MDKSREETFNSLVKDYSEQLYWLVRRIGCSHEDCDDVLQEIYIKVWKGLASFRGECSLYTWIYRIATNEAINYLKKERRRAGLLFSNLEETLVSKIEADPWFCGNEVERLLSKEVALLPERQRLVFIMRYYQEMPYEEISQILGTSEGALKASFHIAKEKIVAALRFHDFQMAEE